MRAYLVALCQASTLDAESNNLTLFKLVEEAQIIGVEIAPGLPAPFESHFYFEVEVDELNVAFEVRGVWVAEDGTRTPHPPNQVLFTTRRLRMRSPGVFLPPGLGSFHLQVEWRRTGALEWERSASAWPLVLAGVPVPAPMPV